MGAAQRRELHAYARSYVTEVHVAGVGALLRRRAAATRRRRRRAVARAAPPTRQRRARLPRRVAAPSSSSASAAAPTLGGGGGRVHRPRATRRPTWWGPRCPISSGVLLLRDPANVVLVTSSRSRARMGELLDSLGGADDGGAPAGELWALAENGVFARRGDGGWEATVQAAQESSWMEMAHEVCSYYAERTPESVLEVRERTIRWGYAAAAADLAAASASGLVEHLEKVLASAPVEVIREGASVEVRPHGASVGHGLLQLLAADFKRNLSSAELPLGAAPSPFDFALALGNFTARDEEVFTSLHALRRRRPPTRRTRPTATATPTATAGGSGRFGRRTRRRTRRWRAAARRATWARRSAARRRRAACRAGARRPTTATAPRCRSSVSTRVPSTCARWTCRRAAPSPSRWATTRPRRAPTWRASAPRAACCVRSLGSLSRTVSCRGATPPPSPPPPPPPPPRARVSRPPRTRRCPTRWSVRSSSPFRRGSRA